MLRRLQNLLSSNEKSTQVPENSRRLTLSYQRERALSCVSMRDRFELGSGDDIHTAFHAYAKRVADKWGHLNDPLSVGLIATLALLSGSIDAAERILDTLPNEPIKTDHGAGYCLVLPFESLCAVLPLPDNLRDIRNWTRGSAIEQDLRAWLADHRSQLMWDDKTETYRL